jgi:hypothetical protein
MNGWHPEDLCWRLRIHRVGLDSARFDQLQNLGTETPCATFAIQGLKDGTGRRGQLTSLGGISGIAVEVGSTSEEALALVDFRGRSPGTMGAAGHGKGDRREGRFRLERLHRLVGEGTGGYGLHAIVGLPMRLSAVSDSWRDPAGVKESWP